MVCARNVTSSACRHCGANVIGPFCPVDGTVSEASRIGRYHIESQIGTDQSTFVFAGVDLAQSRTVAIKIFRQNIDELSVRRLLRSARDVSRLCHPNLVRLLDCGVEEKTRLPFVVVERTSSRGTLVDLLSRPTTLPTMRAARMLLQIIRGLNHAHAAGIVHGEITPSNVLIGRDDIVRLGDGGVSGLPREAEPRSAATFASDVYAFGRVAEAMMACEVPPAATPSARHARMELAALVERCLDDDPAARPPASEIEVTLCTIIAAAETQPIRALDALGQYIGGYRLRKRLRHTPALSIYLGEAPASETDVEIALVARDADCEEREAHLVQVAQRLRDLAHPGAPPYLDVGVLDTGQPYAVWERRRNQTLRQWQNTVRPSSADVVAVTAAIARVMAAAHAASLVHGGLEPETIHLWTTVDGRLDVEIVKFGLAALGRAEVESAFPAPEQAAAAPPTTATDVYALAFIVVELLEGRDTTTSNMMGRPHGPSTLEQTLALMLNPQPESRPTMQEVVAMLDDCGRLHEGRGSERTTGVNRRHSAWRWIVVAIISALLVGLAVLGTGLLAGQ